MTTIHVSRLNALSAGLLIGWMLGFVVTTSTPARVGGVAAGSVMGFLALDDTGRAWAPPGAAATDLQGRLPGDAPALPAFRSLPPLAPDEVPPWPKGAARP